MPMSMSGMKARPSEAQGVAGGWMTRRPLYSSMSAQSVAGLSYGDLRPQVTARFSADIPGAVATPVEPCDQVVAHVSTLDHMLPEP